MEKVKAGEALEVAKPPRDSKTAQPPKPASAALPAFVLESIKGLQGEVPKPFPISKQYKERTKKKGVDKEGDAEVTETEESPKCTEKTTLFSKGKPQKKKVAKKAKKARVQESAGSSGYVPEVYSAKRSAFIQNLRNDGHSYQVAKTTWNFSSVKRELLSGVSVSELKRRRFLPKGASENPWAK